MPKTKQTATARHQRNVEKSMREGLLRLNGFDLERTVKGQKSEYHPVHPNLRARFGDGWKKAY